MHGTKFWSLPHAACPNTPINYTAALRGAAACSSCRPALPYTPNYPACCRFFQGTTWGNGVYGVCLLPSVNVLAQISQSLGRTLCLYLCPCLSLPLPASPPPPCCCCPCQKHMLHVLQASLSTVAFLCAVISLFLSVGISVCVCCLVTRSFGSTHAHTQTHDDIRPKQNYVIGQCIYECAFPL